MERRYLRTTPDRCSLRVTREAVEGREESGPPKIEGYGAVFYRDGDPGSEYELWDGLYERIMPGAFDRAIREDDVRSLFNHDSNIVLGRAKAGTLALAVDATGLRYTVTPPDTQLVRDQVLGPIGRGDVSGSSFMFVTRAEAWREETRDGRAVEIRELHEVQLWEVGPVVFPAYDSTTTGLRAAGDLAEVRAAHAAWRTGRHAAEAEAVAVRGRLVQILSLD